MANDYFNHVTNVIPAGIRALAAQVNNIGNEIATGLDKLPTEVELKQNRTIYGGTSTGAADAYVVTLTYTPVLTDGLNFFFKAHVANTGASTVNLNGLGAKSILLASGAALIGGDILLNQQVLLIYESVSDTFRIMSQSSSAGGGGGNATTIALLDESADTTNFVPFAPDATGNQPLRTGTNLTFNSATGNLAATIFTGALTGNVTGNVTGNADTVTTNANLTGPVTSVGNATTVAAAQPSITSLGSLTALQVDNININGNTISSTAGVDLLITPLAGQQIVLDGTIIIDAGVMTGLTALTSTALTGTIQTAAQPNITSLGVIAGFTSTGIDDNSNNETLALLDNSMVLGTAAGANSAIYRPNTTGLLNIRGGNTNGLGGGIRFYGNAHASTADDVDFLSGPTGIFGRWDESAGTFTINTGSGGSKTLALTINADQNLLPVGLRPPTATSAQLNAIANAVNTSARKVQGSMIYNTTTDNPVYAVGNADGSVWVDGAGTTVNTPVA